MHIEMTRKRVDSIQANVARYELTIPFVYQTQHTFAELEGSINYEKYDMDMALRAFSHATGHKKALNLLHDIYNELRYVIPQHHQNLLDDFERALEHVSMKTPDT